VTSSKIFDFVTDFVMFLVIFVVMELLFAHGLALRAWNLESAKVGHNAGLALAMALGFAWRARKR